jgi:hypothetical protein
MPFKKIKVDSLSNLLIELWWLDEYDANKSETERELVLGESVQSLSRILLANSCLKESRKEMFLKAVNDSGQFFIPAYILNNDIRLADQRPHLALFYQNEITDLKEAVLEKIREAAKADKILQRPDSSIILFIWSYFESKEVVSDWLKGELNNHQKAPHVLSRFIGRTTITNHQGAKVHYSISRKMLEAFFVLDEQFENNLKQINIVNLPHWEKFAVEETLKRIDEKKRGVQEAEYF